MKILGIRVPDSLHNELKAEAKREGVSLNQLCLAKLSKPLAWYAQRAEENEKEGR